MCIYIYIYVYIYIYIHICISYICTSYRRIPDGFRTNAVCLDVLDADLGFDETVPLVSCLMHMPVDEERERERGISTTTRAITYYYYDYYYYCYYYITVITSITT